MNNLILGTLTHQNEPLFEVADNFFEDSLCCVTLMRFILDKCVFFPLVGHVHAAIKMIPERCERKANTFADACYEKS